MLFATPSGQETVGTSRRKIRLRVADIDVESALRRRNELWLRLVEAGEWSIGEIAAAHGMSYNSVGRVLRSARQVREQLRDVLEGDLLRA